MVGYENRSQRKKCRLENRLFFITENLLGKVDRAFIMPEVTGSDHCPIALVLKFA